MVVRYAKFNRYGAAVRCSAAEALFRNPFRKLCSQNRWFQVRPAGDWKLRLKANFQWLGAWGISEQVECYLSVTGSIVRPRSQGWQIIVGEGEAFQSLLA